MPEFNPARLVLARQRRRLTQAAVATLIGLTRRGYIRIEQDEVEPGDDTVDKLAAKLHFPREFFYLPDPPLLGPESASFRALSNMSARDRDGARACGVLAIEFHDWISQHFATPEPGVPHLPLAQPEEASRELRQQWQLGEQPIRNLTHLLELRGVRVFSASGVADGIDAFSFWGTQTPFVMLNTRKSAEHARFDMGHELGHLVMHQRDRAQGPAVEREAHAFASSFLMPKADVIANAPRNTSLSVLMRLKARWGVSLIALVHRLADLKMLSEWAVRHLYIEIATRGFRTNEPNPMPRESSQVLTKVLSHVRSNGGGVRKIASDLGLSATEVDSLAFGLATVAVSGGNQAAPRRPSSRPRLMMVPKR